MLFLRFLRFFEGQDILKFDADCGERALGLMNSCGIVYRCPGREEDGSVRVEISHSDRQKEMCIRDRHRAFGAVVGITILPLCASLWQRSAKNWKRTQILHNISKRISALVTE